MLQLKLYAEKGSSNIVLSDGYSAKAYNNETLNNLIENRISGIIIAMAIIVILVSAIIVITFVAVFICTKSHTNSKWGKTLQKNRPAVLSLTILSFILNIYIVIVAFLAASDWNAKEKNDLYSFNDKHTLVPICTTLVVDIIFFIALVLIVFIAVGYNLLYTQCHDDPQTGGDGSTDSNVNSSSGNNLNNKDIESNTRNVDKTYLILSLTVLCPALCVIAHSPYIAIAYLNDGSHASSIFIYYTVLCFLFFGVMWVFFNWCLQYPSTIELNNQREQSTVLSESSNNNATQSDDQRQDQPTSSDSYMYYFFGKFDEWIKNKLPTSCESKYLCSRFMCFILPLTISVVFLLGLVITVTCYFVLIPINKAISDAPNCIVSIYQSGGFLIGSFIVYKVLRHFYTKSEKKVTLKDIHNIMTTWINNNKEQSPAEPNQPQPNPPPAPN